MTEKTQHQLLHEAMYMLPRGEHQLAILGLMARESGYEGALRGIAACGTAGSEDCTRLARNALDKHGVKWGFAMLGET